MAEVLAPSRPHSAQPYSSPSAGPLLHSSSSSRSSLENLPYSQQSRIPSPAAAPSRPRLAPPAEDPDDSSSTTSSLTQSSTSGTSSPVFSDPNLASTRSTPPSILALDTPKRELAGAADDDENLLPTYDYSASTASSHRPMPPGSPDNEHDYHSSTSDSTPPEEPVSPDVPHVADDSEAREEPTRQVDYLSHDWREEDIWSSWKHIVSKRRVYGERSRLENASWRTWAKQKNHLKTVSPERLNWLKDCDVTWLYGPLQQRSPKPSRGSEPSSRLSKSNSFINKKPILKKRSASEIMLQRSLSSSSLVKQAAAAVQAQRTFPDAQGRPSFGRSRSEYGSSASSNPADFSNAFPSASSSGVQSPEAGSTRKHIRFDNKVEQRIAVEFNGVSGEEETSTWHAVQDDTSSEDDLPIMKPTMRRHSSNIPSSRSSFSSCEQKGIAMLPSTTLKFDDGRETQQPPPTPSLVAGILGSRRSGILHSSPSQETLRPSDPSANFLINDEEDEEDDDGAWRPSGAFAHSNRPENGSASSHLMPRIRLDTEADETDGDRSGLRRTNSGMFMPYSEDDEESLMNSGLFGRVIDTVNTARDIAHVIWNVGWRK